MLCSAQLAAAEAQQERERLEGHVDQWVLSDADSANEYDGGSEHAVSEVDDHDSESSGVCVDLEDHLLDKQVVSEQERRLRSIDRVIASINFYFGDENYSKDQFLRKQAVLDPTGHGWISVDIVASFKKIRRITEDRAIIMECVQRCSVVVLNAEGTHICRRVLLLKDVEDTCAKTVLLGNVAPTESTESIRERCSVYGNVVRIRFPFYSRDELPENVKKACFDPNGNLKFGFRLEKLCTYALVEYATIKQATAANKRMISERGWHSNYLVSWARLIRTPTLAT